MKPTIIWFYAGVRVGKSGKRLQLFVRADNGEEAVFRGIKRVSLGYAYLGYANQMPCKPICTDKEPSTAQVRAWELANLTAKAELKPVVKSRTSPEMKAAVDAFNVLLKDVSSITEANKIVVYLSRELLTKRKRWSY